MQSGICSQNYMGNPPRCCLPFATLSCFPITSSIFFSLLVCTERQKKKEKQNRRMMYCILIVSTRCVTRWSDNKSLRKKLPWPLEVCHGLVWHKHILSLQCVLTRMMSHVKAFDVKVLQRDPSKHANLSSSKHAHHAVFLFTHLYLHNQLQIKRELICQIQMEARPR